MKYSDLREFEQSLREMRKNLTKRQIDYAEHLIELCYEKKKIELLSSLDTYKKKSITRTILGNFLHVTLILFCCFTLASLIVGVALAVTGNI